MKSFLRSVSLFFTLAAFAGSLGCSSSGGAKAVEGSLLQQLGGAAGVTRLATQFGANLAANPALSKLLDSSAINMVKKGLTNDILTASGLAPSDATTLESSFKGKGLDATTFASVSNALAETGVALGIPKDTMDSVNGLLKPLAKSVSGK